MGASIQMLIAGILQTSLGIILGEHNSFHLTQNGMLSLGYLIVFVPLSVMHHTSIR